MSRATRITGSNVRATCLRCRWSSSAPNAHGNAARHHDASGHAVEVIVTRTIVYGDPSAVPEGQEGLELDGAGYQESTP